MANFKAVVRKQRVDGFYPVYIRLVHRRRMGYIKTDKVVSPKQIAADGDIKDAVVNEYCSRVILKYTDMINRKDISGLTVLEVIEYLTAENQVESFSDYAKIHIARMIERGQERNAKNYKLAVASLEKYLGTNQISFAQLSSTVLNKWIESLGKTNRAKEMYPVCVRQIFKAALVE
ncbi:MAG: phage integrase SAM-like domain-containing protein, partial [Muribaculaceae bacterium]|nr:phage integrase SAM-like domain-containing protein [Bacteroidales bacterium]MDY6186096.1 phage integrase SAM-like domain-containing protein [Muribaculaceae bacterium]